MMCSGDRDDRNDIEEEANCGRDGGDDSQEVMSTDWGTCRMSRKGFWGHDWVHFKYQRQRETTVKERADF